MRTNDWQLHHWTTPYNYTPHHEFQFIGCLRDNFMNQFISDPARYCEGQRANILDLFLEIKLNLFQRLHIVLIWDPDTMFHLLQS